MIFEAVKIRERIGKIPVLKGLLFTMEGDLHYIGGE